MNMNTSDRAELACKLVREQAEKRYYFGQASFNYQFRVLATIAKKGYMEQRHDWRGFR